METFTFTHASYTAHVALFHPVKNAAEIRKRIVEAARMQGEQGEEERQKMDFAFIEAGLVTSKEHLRTAIHQAVIGESLRTKTVHSEVIFMLNPTNNITESIRRYGVSDSSNALIVVHITNNTSDVHVEKRMKDVVDGELVPFTDLQTDWDRVKKYHKLPNLPTSQIDNIVTSTVAIKTVMQ
ncbi:hypothetical protein VNI00_004885 [Paramarasmius palmivorus]|uniref:EKC/KEOPS complex subunit CGI121 n=1 Tax=Paramarasmius palmivorus TaxID=297713 RepID=A0AAW0DLM1_9AGAR